MERSDTELIAQLDDHQYNEAELIELRVPLNTPYISSWSDYERVNGQVECNGVFYNYVLRKVQNDTLYLKCLPNKAKTTLQAVRGQRAGEDTKSVKTRKMADYNQPLLVFYIVPPVANLKSPFMEGATHLMAAIQGKPWHPPQGIA